LSDLAYYLEERGKTMMDYGLPSPTIRTSEVDLHRANFHAVDLMDHAISMQLGRNNHDKHESTSTSSRPEGLIRQNNKITN